MIPSFVFEKIFVISEKIQRASLTDYFWPNEQKTFQRQVLIDRGERLGWICEFTNKGLGLSLRILLSQEQYPYWTGPAFQTRSLNVIQRDLHYYENFDFFPFAPQLIIKHPLDLAEKVRSAAYISGHFQERADSIWASQIVWTSDNLKSMYYMIGFNRDVDESDLNYLGEIARGIRHGLSSLSEQDVDFILYPK